ncbi:MAG: sigma-70 family RNA polymerase sigma factor [Bacteroidota bacterium]
MDHWNDKELFAKIKEGSKEALAILFLRYYDYLKHYGYQIVPDSILVEECIQEMFMYLFESHERLGNVLQVKAYLFSSLRRRLIEKVKKERRRKDGFDIDFLIQTDIQFSPEDLRLEEENQRHIREILAQNLNQLPWRQREAIYLRYHNGLSTKEIAEVMGITNQTVLNTLYQALKKIRRNKGLQKLLNVFSQGVIFVSQF